LTGLGEVHGRIESGQAAPSVSLPVAAPVEIWLGNTLLRPSFAGLTPGLAGVYRVDFDVPVDLQDGVYAIRVVTGGASSRPANLDVVSNGSGDRNDRARSRVHRAQTVSMNPLERL
jgi:uncharacterized protein (TIGR03437 family)